ncbi:unnamed protein product [Brassica napus]|uniref:(rape) hypothetical protein n=1 Tax=Brassica napus TaxID=3708 RepID=A0A816KS34_BRANA|nr:unnamed protein product [Brassica napus]
MTARCDVATKSADSVNAESDLSEEEIEAKAKVGSLIRVTAPLKGPDGMVYHCHDGLAPHSHEPIYSPGYFSCRAPSLNDRNFSERALTVGIGVPVGTGNFEFGVGLQMGSGNWGRYSLLPLKRRLLCCLLQIVVLLLSKAVKVFTEELVPANPDILEGILGRLIKDLRRKDSFFSGRRTSAIGKCCDHRPAEVDQKKKRPAENLVL